MAARIVAVLFALAGLFGVTVAADEGQVVDAVNVLVLAVGSLYAAWRTWRAKQLAARPPGVAIDPGELVALRAEARNAGRWRAELNAERSRSMHPPVERDPAYDAATDWERKP